ncbi:MULTISPECIES: dihydropteroate synthase [unclassified Bosea (in: a-proteobacteria)]|uniref:dihydropteroate synthase n=1 Tax=unclassified Bosea (in: a-proteobacteria) TaxID=2653178 RepID=UPI000F764EA2|nr:MULTISPECIES: dihydropteroate synthase [unclassified Bosea (in: a-proteobacteria)]AZO80401.1 dihydropteroate synthase [Bosea sp. Tri-49]RXT23203.1 dihydropteroate synthase [Bosea sp. Tri-39]RXT38675.1 dihydropteroate synthase [Bosea sp. Tri-54]
MNATLTLPDGRRLSLGARPLLMGVVNVTPDSFSDGGLFANPAVAIAHGLKLAQQGADIVDVGGESTRPDHIRLEAQSELARVMPVIIGIAAKSDIPISIDTYKAEVAEAALKAGASIVNDVWGAQRDPAIAGIAARHGAPIILMHNREEVDPGLDILADVMRFLERSIAIAIEAGVPRGQIVVDPGIGRFGKTAEQSLLLMKELGRLAELGCPVLLGASRKSVLGHVIGKAVPAQRVAASIAAHLYGVTQGAAIIRAHDVDEHVDALKIWAAIGEAR